MNPLPPCPAHLFEAASPWAEEHARRAQRALEELRALNPPERLREVTEEMKRAVEGLERRLGGRAVS
jgi:rubrerythrin